jgi:hypothetical protein
VIDADEIGPTEPLPQLVTAHSAFKDSRRFVLCCAGGKRFWVLSRPESGGRVTEDLQAAVESKPPSLRFSTLNDSRTEHFCGGNRLSSSRTSGS